MYFWPCAHPRNAPAESKDHAHRCYALYCFLSLLYSPSKPLLLGLQLSLRGAHTSPHTFLSPPQAWCPQRASASAPPSSHCVSPTPWTHTLLTGGPGNSSSRGQDSRRGSRYRGARGRIGRHRCHPPGTLGRTPPNSSGSRFRSQQAPLVREVPLSLINSRTPIHLIIITACLLPKCCRHCPAGLASWCRGSRCVCGGGRG